MNAHKESHVYNTFLAGTLFLVIGSLVVLGLVAVFGAIASAR
jgi:hypothetical protein